MQRQEINLYKPFAASNPAANFLNWQRLCYSFLIIAILFIIYYCILLGNFIYLEKQNARIQTQSKKLENEFLALKSTFPPLFFANDVNISVETLKKQLEEQKLLLDSLGPVSIFSKNLTAFATDIVPNVWLTNITIDNSGRSITLKGKSTDMQTLQSFFSQITKNSLFNGYIFNADNVAKADVVKDQGNLIFELSMSKPNA